MALNNGLTMEDNQEDIIITDQDSEAKGLITGTVMVGMETLNQELLYIRNVKFVREGVILLLTVFTELLRVLPHILLLNVRFVVRGDIVHWNAIIGEITPINLLELLPLLHLYFLVNLLGFLNHRVLFNSLRILLLIIHISCIHLHCKG